MWVFRSAIWPASLLKIWLTLAECYNETWPSKLLLTYHMLVSVQFLEPGSYDCEKKYLKCCCSSAIYYTFLMLLI